MTTTGPICTLALLTHCAFGGLLGGLFDCLKDHHRGHEYNGPDCCRACLVEQRTVINLIAIMQQHPNWRERDDAAHELREFDWRCHPEIAPALAFTMLEDPHEEVREEAAETLAKLAPCDPAAHVALREAAVADPDHATRKWARRALAKLDHRCLDDCPICGPAPAAVVEAPVPTIIEEEVIVPPGASGRVRCRRSARGPGSTARCRSSRIRVESRRWRPCRRSRATGRSWHPPRACPTRTPGPACSPSRSRRPRGRSRSCRRPRCPPPRRRPRRRSAGRRASRDGRRAGRRSGRRMRRPVLRFTVGRPGFMPERP